MTTDRGSQGDCSASPNGEAEALQQHRRTAAPGEAVIPCDEKAVRPLEDDLKATGDELRGAIAELLASKEELQSLNAELTAVNQQLRDKVQELSATSNDLANLLSSIELATLFLDRQSRIKRFTPAARKLFNLVASDMGRPLSEFSHRLCDFTLREDVEAALARLPPIKKEVRDENGRWYLRCVLPYRTQDNRIEGAVATFTDITDAKQAEDALRKVKNRLQLLLESSSEGIYGVDQAGLCIFANQAFTELTGYKAEEVLGKRVHDFIHHSRSDATPLPWEECFVYRSLTEGSSHPRNHDLCWRKDGTSFPASLSANPVMEDGRVTGAVVIFRDVTETVVQSRKLDYLASHDPLTQLLNRRAFEERLDRVIETARSTRSEHVLCYLDLDRFKLINDSCGHLAGDELLRVLAGLLRAQIRKRDTVSRVGGDEFAVLMEQCGLEQARRAANGMQTSIANFRFPWDDQVYSVGASIGLVPITAEAGTRSEVLRAADAACYAAKAAGGNRIHVHRPDDTGFVQQQAELQWTLRIQRAIEEERLQLSFQPIVPLELESHAACGELLLRMRDEGGRLLVAEEFFSAAERYGFGPRLDRWVIAEAFQWFSLHPGALDRLAWCAINLSGDSLSRDEEFLDFVLAEFQKSRLPPEKICFEITESAVIANLVTADRFIQRLKQLGCRFALDDFGRGVAAFNYLRALPVDFLKISGVFVRDMGENPVNLVLVRSIQEIAQALGKKTIAEWVETETTLEALRNMGIDFAQGHATGKPRRLDQIAET
jgi:two-component system CheB/CheR fusion protein